MKIKNNQNRELMNEKELKDLFGRWFPNGISKEEGWVLWSIFSNNNRYLYIKTNEIIETGTFRWFANFLSKICNDKTSYIDFYMADYYLDFMDVETIKKVHRIVNPEIEFIEDYWEDGTSENLSKTDN